MMRALVVATLLTACSAEPPGVVRLALDAAAVPEGVDRLTLTLAAPDIAPREVEVDLDTLVFEEEVPPGDARSLTVLAESDAAGAWLPWYWGTTSFSLAPEEVRDVVVPAVPAARIVPQVILDGAEVEGAIVTTELVDPQHSDLPASFEDESAPGAGRTLPAGAVRLSATLTEAVLEWHTVAPVTLDLVQGDVVTVPLVLDPQVDVPVVARLQIGLGEVRVGEAVDLIVRAVDDAGALVESFDGVVELVASDPLALGLPGPYRFDPEVDGGEHVFPGGAVGLAALAGVVVRATVQGDPAISGERTVDVLAIDEVVGEAVRFVLEVLGDVHGGLLARPVDVRVTALDEAGRVATGYAGVVTFADSDRLLLAVPADTAFTPEDGGIHHFEGGLLSLVLGGVLATLRVHDVDDPSIAGDLAIDIL